MSESLSVTPWRLAPPFEALVFHTYAVIPLLPHARRENLIACLSQPPYRRWAEGHLPTDAFEPVWAALPMLSALASKDRGYVTLQNLARSACSPLEFLRREAEAGESPAEEGFAPLFRMTLALCAEGFDKGYSTELLSAVSDAESDLVGALNRAAALAPILHNTAIHFVPSLGIRGRLFSGSHVAIGLPLKWTGLSPEQCALTALHEVAVGVASTLLGTTEWSAVERTAIDGVRALVGDTEWRAPFAERLARHSLHGLEPNGDPVTAHAVANRLRERA